MLRDVFSSHGILIFWEKGIHITSERSLFCHRLPIRSSEWLLYLALLFLAAFVLIKLFFLSTFLSHYYFSTFLPQTVRGTQGNKRVVFSCPPGLKHCMKARYYILNLYTFLFSDNASYQLLAQKEQQVYKHSWEGSEDARALCAQRARTIRIGQGRLHLPQSLAKGFKISGEPFMRMPLLRELPLFDTFLAP